MEVAVMSRSPCFSYRSREFGRHVRSCRRARGLTQEQLAQLSGLSPDTIRRLEHGSFSPSLETLSKLSLGLELSLSTLFGAFEVGERCLSRELIDLVTMMGPREQLLMLQLAPVLREFMGLGESEPNGDT